MEELENTANEALRLIIDNAAAAKDFILAELPDVVQQLLIWKFCESLACCVPAILIVVAIIAWVRFVKKRWQKIKENEPVVFFGGILSCVTIIVGLLISIKLINLTWLQIWLAPKIYVIEYASNLVK